jgi:hypothetical protein
MKISIPIGLFRGVSSRILRTVLDAFSRSTPLSARTCAQRAELDDDD